MKSEIDKTYLIKRTDLLRNFYNFWERIRIFLNNLIGLSAIFILYKRGNAPDKRKKLLLVNTGDLGDNIITFSFLNAFSNSKIFDEIHLLVKNQNYQIYNFLNPGYTILQWNKKKYKSNLFYKLKFIRTLRGENYHTTFNITPERGILNEELTLCSGAEYYWRIDKADLFINPVFSAFFNKKYQKSFIINSYNEYEILDETRNQLSIKEASESFERDILGKNTSENFIVMAPFASDRKRTWGLENYLLLAEALSEKYLIYFIGSENNYRSVQNLNIKNSRIKNLCGQITLENIPKFLVNAKLFIGNDSGLTHLALFLRVPLIAIIGGGMYGRFFPYNESDAAKYFSYEMECFGCGWNCIYKEKYCLTGVSIESVLQESFKILEKYAVKIKHI